jgi:hypothetical protein
MGPSVTPVRHRRRRHLLNKTLTWPCECASISMPLSSQWRSTATFPHLRQRIRLIFLASESGGGLAMMWLLSLMAPWSVPSMQDAASNLRRCNTRRRLGLLSLRTNERSPHPRSTTGPMSANRVVPMRRSQALLSHLLTAAYSCHPSSPIPGRRVTAPSIRQAPLRRAVRSALILGRTAGQTSRLQAMPRVLRCPGASSLSPQCTREQTRPLTKALPTRCSW